MSQIIINCGLDEAGRGPLAGPVTAGAVILPPDFPLEILNDSKKISEKKRASAELVIKEKALWGLGVINHDTIDKVNILQASMLAMKNAFDMLMIKFNDWVINNNLDPSVYCRENILCIADGNKIPPVEANCKCEVKADARFECVMAASIIAKVARDNIMLEYDKLYPQYNYKQHKGYPTEAHRKICRELGPSPIQRLSFSY